MNKIIPNHILVVEDELIISSKIAEKLSYIIDIKKIILATTVKEALGLLDKLVFKIIVLDLNLSDGSGMDVLNQVKKDNLKSLVYVFSVNSEFKKICIKKGATAFFDKSKDFDNLISTITKAYS